VNVGFLLSALVLLRAQLIALGKAPSYLWVLGSLAFFPIFMALIRGQDSVLLLLLYCLALRSFHRSAEAAAGSWLGLGLYKYHLVVPFAFPLFLRKRFMAGFVALAAFLLTISLAVTGWQGLLAYPRYVWRTDHDLRYVWNTTLGNTANLHGLIWALVPESQSLLRTGLVVVASITMLAVMVHAWRKYSGGTAECRQALLALGIVGTILLSYHIYVHDLSLLFLAILLGLDVLLSDAAIPGWTKTTLYSCLAILYLSPLYVVLTLRYGQLQLMAIVLLVFFIVLLSLIRSLQTRRGAAISPPASAGR
jgi:hypothetical protein